MMGNLSTSLTKPKLPTLADVERQKARAAHPGRPSFSAQNQPGFPSVPRPLLHPAPPCSLNQTKPASAISPATLLRSRRNPNQSHSLRACPEPSRMGREPAPAPQPSLQAVFDQYALYGLAGQAVRTLAPHTEAQPEAILLQLLAAFGNVIGPGPHCMVGATRHTLNLFVVLVGESSKARKGTSWNQIARLFAEVDPTWTENRVTSARLTARGLIGILGRAGRRSPSARARRGTRLRAAHHGPQPLPALAPAALRLG